MTTIARKPPTFEEEIMEIEESMNLLQQRAESFLNENEVPDEIFIYNNLDLMALFAKGEVARFAKTIAKVESLETQLEIAEKQLKIAREALHPKCKFCIEALAEIAEVK